MKTLITLFGVGLMGLSGLSAQTAETWTLADGRSFEGSVKSVTPGMVLFSRPGAADAPLEIAKLSEASRKHLIEVLGLSLTAAAPALAPAPVISPQATTMPAATRSSGAIDATDISMIDSRFGLTAAVVGQVKEVVTLGSTGHKRINFEGTGFNVFINKRNLDKSSEWKLDGLAGKTVQIEGEVTKYQEQVQIQITAPSQIGLIEK